LINAALRSLWGFLAMVVFCWFWGIEGITIFALASTVYFVFVHWLFDKIVHVDKWFN